MSIVAEPDLLPVRPLGARRPGWVFVAATPADDLLGELTEARARKLTFRLGGPAEASFSIDGRHELALLADELTTDLVVYRDTTRLFRGRLGASTDDLNADTHTVTLTAVDYRAMLGRVYVTAASTSSNVEQAQIVAGLLAAAQLRPGGNYGIAYTVVPTGVLRTITFDSGKPIAECVDDLAALVNGFDWEIDPTLVLRLFHPARGVERDLVAEYGSTVTSLRRSFDPAGYANSVIVTGAQGLVPVIRDAADVATRPEGRIEAIESYPDINSATVLAARADQALAARSAITPSYVATLAPDVWHPEALWLGDATWLVARSGRLDIARPERVHEIAVTIDDNGAETIDVTFGAVAPSLAVRLRATARRLNRLERLGAA